MTADFKHFTAFRSAADEVARASRGRRENEGGRESSPGPQGAEAAPATGPRGAGPPAADGAIGREGDPTTAPRVSADPEGTS